MTAVAVTGAAGSVGEQVVRRLAGEESVDRIEAIDHPIHLGAPLPPGALAGCRTVVHLPADGSLADERASTTALRNVLDAADRVGCGHVVLVSSALVYGARSDNPVPLTEHHRRRPEPHLAPATINARLEELVEAWSESTGGRVAVLRPTTTLSDRGVSAVAAELRRATAMRSEPGTPPVQFLHRDDLVAAVSLVAGSGLTGVYNVAPDGWIDPDLFHELAAEAALSLPEPIDGVRARAASLVGRRRVVDGIEPYVRHPWVVANDRLRRAGWAPAFTNEEAFVVGHPAPAWRRFVERRRQELTLGAAAAVAVGVLGAAGTVARRSAARLRP